MTHTLYVAAAYGISALTLAALAAWILLDQAGRRRDLAELERRGIRRRADLKRGDAA